MAGVDILASAFSGANAAFIADLYARWIADPASVDGSFAELFESLNDEARAVLTDASGASWAPRHFAVGEADAKPQKKVAAARSAGAGARAAADRPRARRHQGQPAGADADPHLSRARPPGSEARPARPAGEAAASGTRPETLRLHRCRHGPADLHRRRARPRNRDRAADRAGGSGNLLRPDRRRVHAHPGPRPEGLDPAPRRGRAVAHAFRRRRQEDDPAAPHRSRGAGGVLPAPLRRHQAFWS